MIAVVAHANVRIPEMFKILEPLEMSFRNGFPIPGVGLQYVEVLEILSFLSDKPFVSKSVKNIAKMALAGAFGGGIGQYDEKKCIKLVSDLLSYRTSTPPRSKFSKRQIEQFQLFLLFLKDIAEEEIQKPISEEMRSWIAHNNI